MQEALLAQPVFTVDERTYRWHDVVAAGRRWSAWTAVEARTREGIACRRRAEEAGDPLTPDEVGKAAADFRYERRLLSADELEGWLSRWELSLPYWMEWVRRTLLRKRWVAQLSTLTARYAVGNDEVAEFVATEAVCSGALEQIAAMLAERAAVADAMDEATDTSELSTMDDAFQRFCAAAASPQAIEREVHAQHVDWLRIECRWLAHEQEDVVREAALCVREDGRDLARVAADAGAHLAHDRIYLETAEPALRGHLLGARRGDLLGPLALAREYRLIEVVEKLAPSAEDPEIRERAARVLVRRAVQGEVVNRVRWHEHLQG
jgi:hypothetical protein